MYYDASKAVRELGLPQTPIEDAIEKAVRGSATMATSAVKPIGLVIPTRWEAGDVLRRFAFQKIGRAGLYKATPRTDDAPCSAFPASDAKPRAGPPSVWSSKGRGELVSMGFCGALVPELRVGDLVTHRLATVDTPVRTPEERRALAGAGERRGRRHGNPGDRRSRHAARVFRSASCGSSATNSRTTLTPLFGKSGTFSCWRSPGGC